MTDVSIPMDFKKGDVVIASGYQCIGIIIDLVVIDEIAETIATVYMTPGEVKKINTASLFHAFP